MGHTAEVRKTIATSGGIEAVARAMTVHVDDNSIQEDAVMFISKFVNTPAHIAMVKAAGMVPLLQHAVAMGVNKGDKYGWDPADQLKKMGV